MDRSISINDDGSRKTDAQAIADADQLIHALKGDVRKLRAAIGYILPLAEQWADGKGRSHIDHESVADAKQALEETRPYFGTWIRCLRCDWEGPAEELRTIHPSDGSGIGAVCPKCGSDDSDMDTDCEAP